MTAQWTTEDAAIIWSRNLPRYITDRNIMADRNDATLMHSAQRYNLARAIAKRGEPESEAIQVR